MPVYIYLSSWVPVEAEQFPPTSQRQKFKFRPRVGIFISTQP